MDKSGVDTGNANDFAFFNETKTKFTLIIFKYVVILLI